MLGWWSLKSHLTAPLLLCDLFMDCLLRNESLRGIFPLRNNMAQWKVYGMCSQADVGSLYAPDPPSMPFGELILLSFSCPSKKNAVDQSSPSKCL